MPYNKKILLLGSAAAFLTIVYILTLILDPARINARNELFSWMTAASRDEADRIEVFSAGRKTDMALRNGSWFVLLGQQEIPARQGRLDDLFRLLSTRGAFPRRGISSKSHAELGLDGSSRLIIRGGGGLSILDILVGKDDSSGKSVFLRKSGENEFRSGDKLISAYINGEQNSWMNLKLFDDKSVAQVQRVLVYFRDFYGLGEETSLFPYEDYTIKRSGENWQINNDLDKDRTENWVRAILEASGDDIIPVSPDEISNSSAAIAILRIELGDGAALELQIQEPDENGKAIAVVNGKPYLFLLSQWTVIRLLRNQDYFAGNI
jgi:hypothetical protein